MTILGTLVLNFNFYRNGYKNDPEEMYTDNGVYLWTAILPVLMYMGTVAGLVGYVIWAAVKENKVNLVTFVKGLNVKKAKAVRRYF